MGTKNNPGEYDCYANADPNEPMFVLLGRDRFAPSLVRAWADARSRAGGDAAKIAEARKCADQLEEWALSLEKTPEAFDSDQYGVAHHGPPILTERDVAICQAMSLWIETARGAGRPDYQMWVPTYADIIKSRLFWRIRSGKKPLPEPPPTCFSCPWYEVVEDLGPHDIFDVHPYPAQWLPKGRDLVSVGQCSYDVIERHEDGSMTAGFHRWRFKLWRDLEAWARRIAEYNSGRPPQHQPKEYEGWFIERKPALESEQKGEAA